eukprot:CAMPEP_0168536126 /NCGR_PEP_ID=MMETSP0405-20121227/19289_1 /TAXON_ID=498012 /ORGANISM="Trichosphaerium sp, Strain Am-I-7 wt" /LENGTH=300 /DNA_ID=CAMNT_0008563923 /DNA_START=342 /DNA_END=1241 /DNA_ORIENTATION=+
MCQARQLQLLFGNLQLGTAPASLVGLTKAFGWSEADNRTPHDFVEFLTMLLDKLSSVKGITTSIDSIFTGELLHCIACQGCKHVRERKESFITLPVTAKQPTLEKAFDAFLVPELLKGDNKYMCDPCNSKQDALMGAKIGKLPDVFAIVLQRFEFDFMTMQRVKVNSRVEFPFELDMTPFYNVELSKRANTSQQESREPEDDDEENDEQENPNAYSLYGVVCHMGTAHRGHYFMYLKDINSKTWHKFSDTTVTPLTEDKLKEMYGGSTGAFQKYSNAYVLLYRKTSAPQTNISDSDVPEW